MTIFRIYINLLITKNKNKNKLSKNVIKMLNPENQFNYPGGSNHGKYFFLLFIEITINRNTT